MSGACLAVGDSEARRLDRQWILFGQLLHLAVLENSLFLVLVPIDILNDVVLIDDFEVEGVDEEGIK